MTNPVSHTIDDYLRPAYALASRILPGGPITEIVCDAYDAAPSYRQRQIRGFSIHSTLPKKQLFDRIEAFQFALYQELEGYEIIDERVSRPSADLFMFRYLKLIVFSSFTRNPFRTTVSIAGFLYGFDLDNLHLLFGFVTQAGSSYDLSQNDKNDVFRDLKDELIRRFTGYLLPCHPDGNRSIVLEFAKPSVQLLSLVQEQLAILVPWGREDQVQTLLKAFEEAFEKEEFKKAQEPYPNVPKLLLKGTKNRDAINSLWRTQKFAVMNPKTFNKMVKVLNLPDPATTLQVPVYASTAIDDKGSGPMGEPPVEFYKQLYKHVADRRRRRRELQKQQFSILVDDQERPERLDASSSRDLQLIVPRSSRSIKIVGEDEQGKLPVADLSLAHHRDEIDELGVATYLCNREGAAPITIKVELAPNREHYTLLIRCRNPRRSLFESLALQVADVFANRWGIVTTVAAITVLVAGMIYFFTYRSMRPTEEVANGPVQVETPTPAVPTPDQSLIVKETPNEPGGPTPGNVAVPHKGSNSDGDDRTHQIVDNGRQIDYLHNGQSVALNAYGGTISDDVLRSLRNRGSEYASHDDLRFIPLQPMGNSTSTSRFTGCPNGTVVRSQRPVFKWKNFSQSGTKVESYEVRVFDAVSFDQVDTSGPLKARNWVPSRALERGKVYSWELIVNPGGQELRLPGNGVVKFQILDQITSDRLAQAEGVKPQSDLILADLYARAGLYTESTEKLHKLMKQNRASRELLTLLKTIESKRVGTCSQ